MRKNKREAEAMSECVNGVALITEAFGHGIGSLLLAKAYGKKPVAFSEKLNKDEFEHDVEQIYNNLVFFAPNMSKATWEDREELLVNGWNVRYELLNGLITQEMWAKAAQTKLMPEVSEKLPQFIGLKQSGCRVLFIPQKLVSDGVCGISAAQQSVPLEVFEFLKKWRSYDKYVLGQHFHKENDKEKVEALAKSFAMYVPGMTEDREVFGIRGVPHKKYWHMYEQINLSIGIAGTHTWYLLACFPGVPQIILYNKKGVERWDLIEKAYQDAGYEVFCIGFDENTDWEEFSKEVEKLYNQF